MTSLAKAAKTNHVEVMIEVPRKDGVNMFVMMNMKEFITPSALPTRKPVHDPHEGCAIAPFGRNVEESLFRHARRPISISFNGRAVLVVF